jgi:hypothetical protein
VYYRLPGATYSRRAKDFGVNPSFAVSNQKRESERF